MRSQWGRKKFCPHFCSCAAYSAACCTQELPLNRRQIILAGTMAALDPCRARPRPSAPGAERRRPSSCGQAARRAANASRCARKSSSGCPTDPCATASSSMSPARSLTLFQPQGSVQWHHAAHRAGRRLCARGHRQGRCRSRRVVHRARVRRRGAALSSARRWLGRRRRRAGPRRHARHAPAARQRGPQGRRRVRAIGVIGFSAGGHLVRAPDHRTRARVPAARCGRRSVGATRFRSAHVSGDHHRRATHAHAGSARQLLARRACRPADTRAVLAASAMSARDTPPTLLVHAARRHQCAGRELAADVRSAAQGAACAANCTCSTAAATASDCAASRAKMSPAWPTLVQNWATEQCHTSLIRRSPAATLLGAASLGALAAITVARAAASRAGGAHHRRPSARHPSTATCRFSAAFATAPTPRRADSCRRWRREPWRGIVDAIAFGAASRQTGLGTQSVRRLPVPQRHGAHRESGAAAAGHRLHPWRRVLERLGIEPAVRRRHLVPPRRRRRRHAQPSAEPVRLSLSARISRIPEMPACSTSCWRCAGCATTSRRSAAIPAASPC